jgi:hypothetical protein
MVLLVWQLRWQIICRHGYGCALRSLRFAGRRWLRKACILLFSSYFFITHRCSNRMSDVPVAEHKRAAPLLGDSRKRHRDEEKQESKDDVVLAHDSRAKRPRVDNDEKLLKLLKCCLASDTLQQSHTKLKMLKLDSTMRIKERRPDGSLLVDVQRKNGKDHHCCNTPDKRHGGPCSLLVSGSRLVNQELGIRSRCWNDAKHQEDIDIDCRLRYSSRELTVNMDSKGDKKRRVAVPADERDLLLDLSDAVQPSDTPVRVPFPANPLRNLEEHHASGTLPFKYEAYESRWVNTDEARIQLSFTNHRKTIFIKSPCGTGKTTTAGEILECGMKLPCPDGKSGALSIVSR